MAASDISFFSLKFLAEAGYSLRYELTFGIVLVVFWSLGWLAGFKPNPTQKEKYIQHAKKPPSPRTSIPKGSPQQSKRSPDAAASAAAAAAGHLDELDASQLCDAAVVVPQITQMCRSQVQQALALYDSAIEAGLKLNTMSENESQQLFVALVTSTIRTGHMEDSNRLLRDLRQSGLGIGTSLFCSVAKLCTSKHLFAECLAVYDFMAEDPSFNLQDKSIWSCLLFSAIEVHSYERCTFFFEQLKACGVPSQKDYGNMVRLAGLQSDWKLSLQLVEEMYKEGCVIDSIIYNTALGTCVSANQIDKARGLLDKMELTEGLVDVITYNTLMKGYAKAGQMDQCLEVFNLLRARNLNPSQVTYGIMLDGYINENQLEQAAKVFSEMNSEGYTMNTVLYTTLIKGFARAGDVDQAMKVYEQMHKERNVTPDLITFSILIKANCDADRLEEALKLLEAMINLNLHPDEVVFNSLLAGCARQANVRLGKKLYEDMLCCGIRPSNATFSILIRFFLQCKLLEDAVEMLKTEPKRHKVVPEPRIFVQLIQSCIRERQGRRSVEVYEMLCDQSRPSASTHKSIFSTCTKLNMYDTASEIFAVAGKRGGHVDRQDANSLLEGAIRKRKLQVAHDIAACMQKMRLPVDEAHQAALSGGKAKA